MGAINTGRESLLYTETRGGLVENIHTGSIAVVGPDGRLIAGFGEPEKVYYYRSASKPIQALPTLARECDLRLGISPVQAAVFAASHLGDQVHIDAVLAVLNRAGFAEEDLIMKPAQGRFGPCRRAAHGCSAKHAALMLLAKELCGDPHDYWKPESAAQQVVLQAISAFADYPAEKIPVGIDGCGVPVFAVPLKSMALSFLRLACPELMEGHSLAPSAKRLGEMITQAPHMIRGEGSMDTLINSDPNLIAKSGKFGVYCIGMRRERLGLAVKINDGDEGHLPVLLSECLRQLGYENQQLIHQLTQMESSVITNDLDIPVGTVQTEFTLF